MQCQQSKWTRQKQKDKQERRQEGRTQKVEARGVLSLWIHHIFLPILSWQPRVLRCSPISRASYAWLRGRKGKLLAIHVQDIHLPASTMQKQTTRCAGKKPEYFLNKGRCTCIDIPEPRYGPAFRD